MYRKLALLFCVSAVSMAISAQQTITGKVLDKDNEGAVEFASVRLLKASDSTLVTGVQTDSRGQFTISKVKDGSYLIRISVLTHNDNFTPVEVAGKNVIVKPIMLEAKSYKMDEITVEGIAAQMVVKGDTIEYNPAAFKLPENAVVEDLLKRLPGVTVDEDGTITVNGEEIKRIRVDGKKFFDEDILTTTRNLPAEIVDRVQVLDLKSDQARLTGFEDDNTERIINLTIKENRNRGIFGNATLGGGMDIKSQELLYNANVYSQLWLAGLQLAITGSANNANVMRSGRGGMGGMGGFGGGMGGGMGGGRTSSENLSANVNAEINKAAVGGDGSYSHSSSYSDSYSDRYSYATAGNTKTEGTNTSERNNNNATMRAEIEWVPDSVTTFIIQPNVNVGWSSSNSRGLSDYSDVKYDSLENEIITPISKNMTRNEQTSESNGGGLSLTFSRRSKVKRGRSLTVTASGSFSNSENDGYQYNKKDTYRAMFGDTVVTLVDQLTQGLSNSYNANVNVSFVEPIFNTNNALQLSIQLRTNGSYSENMKYNKDGSNDYTLLDSTYSNTSTSSRSNERIQLTYQYRETDSRYNYSIGIAADPYQTYTNADYFKGADRKVNETGINFSPNARLRYNLIPTTGQTSATTGGRNRSYVEMSYSGSTRQPSPEQMQPGKNNSNLMSETVGNPDLTPEFSQQMSFSYTHYNAERMSSITTSLSGSFTQNALVSNSITDETRKTWRQTVNVQDDIPFNTNASFTFNAPIFKNRLQFNSNTSANYAQSFSYSDQSASTTNPFKDADSTMLRLAEKGVTNRWGANERIGLTFTTDWLEIGANVNIRYSGSMNSLNNNRITETFDYTPSGNVSLYLPYGWVFTNDLGYTGRSGYGSLTQNELIWNAVISKPVFNNLGTLSLNLYDILQQRQNISESVSDNSRSFSRSNSLTSYFMLNFTYRISQFGGSRGGGGMGGGMRGGMGGGMRGGMGGMF